MSGARVGGLAYSALLIIPGIVAATGDEFSYYVGQSVCLECHAPGGAASACGVDPIPKHGQSFDALTREEASHIAALCGVSCPPTESQICLGCHATAATTGPRWTKPTFDVNDGVQCESCHGAGSIHVESFRTSRAGEPVQSAARLRIPDSDSCSACHRERASHRVVLEEGYRRPAADQQYRTPVSLAISPDGGQLYVVCERSDSLVEVDTRSGTLLGEVAVGHRPSDVALGPDGRTIYVTNRFSNTLSLIDSSTRKVITGIPVGHEPHGVLTDASGDRIYVLNTGQDSVSVLSAKERRETHRLTTGPGPWSIARSPDGSSLYVTHVRPYPGPFLTPLHSEITVIETKRGVVAARPVVAEANGLEGIASVPGHGVALFTLMRTKNLVPLTRLGQGWAITNGLGLLWPDGRVDQVLLDEPAASFADPGDVAVSPDGRFALVTSGGGNEVAVVDVGKLIQFVTSNSDLRRREVLPNHMGSGTDFVVRRISVGKNPRAVVFSPDGRFAYVANALDDSITVLETGGFTVTRVIDLGGPSEVTETRWGEQLFHDARITFGGQFSCRSCHPDGHINGLTFDIEADGIGMHPSDNRTLRGIFDTAPFKWEGTNPSLERQCGPRLAVFFTRLAPFTPSELSALTKYIRTIERPPNPYRSPEGLTVSQRRGQIVFERTTTNNGEPLPVGKRCVTCHSGPYATSRTSADVGTTMWFDVPISSEVPDVDFDDIEQYGAMGLYYFVDAGIPTKSFDVPHLTNIFDSAPYLHNGVAPTLELIWTRFDVLGKHGMTGDLSRRQFNDLIEYLKGL